MASFSNSFSFSVFICKNSWVIPPFQADVTSCSDHAFKVSGFPRHLLSLSSSLFPITFLLLSKAMFTSVRWFTNRYCAAQTHVCVHAQVHIQHIHTGVILSAQSKQFSITVLQSQLSSLHSTSFLAPSPGKKTLKGWTEKENDTAKGGRKQH